MSVQAVQAIVAQEAPTGIEPVVFAYFSTGVRPQAFELTDNSCAPEYPSGTVWVIDPDETPVPGDMVLATHSQPPAPVFGRFRLETSAAGTVVIVEPTNRDWPAARSDVHQHLTVLAVMTQSIKPRANR